MTFNVKLTRKSFLDNYREFFHLTDCGFDVYKKFVTKVEETCVGPNSKAKDKKGILLWRRSTQEPGIKKPTVQMSGRKYCSACDDCLDISFCCFSIFHFCMVSDVGNDCAVKPVWLGC